MNQVPLQAEQLEWVHWIAGLRTAWLDPLFQFLGWLDTDYFVFFLVAAMWMGGLTRWGHRLFAILSVNSVLVGLLKEVFRTSRPTTDAPGIGFFSPKSYGFPSGGAMGAVVLGALLIAYGRGAWRWYVGIGYMLLMGFSRLYLGVHYPIDVLGGWVFGGLAAWGIIRLIDPCERWVEGLSTGQKWGAVAGFALLGGAASDCRAGALLWAFAAWGGGALLGKRWGWTPPPAQRGALLWLEGALGGAAAVGFAWAIRGLGYWKIPVVTLAVVLVGPLVMRGIRAFPLTKN